MAAATKPRQTRTEVEAAEIPEGWLSGLGELSRAAVGSVVDEYRAAAARWHRSSVSDQVVGDGVTVALNAVGLGYGPKAAERIGLRWARRCRDGHNAARARDDPARIVGPRVEPRNELSRLRRELESAGAPKELNLLGEVVAEQRLTKGQIQSVRQGGPTLRERMDEWQRRAAARKARAAAGRPVTEGV